MLIIQIVVLLIALIVITSYLVFSKRKRIKRKQEVYINRKLINLSMRKDIYVLKNKFDDYSILLDEVDRILGVIGNEGQFEFSKLKLRRVGVFEYIKNREEVKHWNQFYKQLDESKLNDYEIFEFVNTVLQIRREIIAMNFPIKIRYFEKLDSMELNFIRILLFVLEASGSKSNSDKFKDIDSFNPNTNDKLCTV